MGPRAEVVAHELAKLAFELSESRPEVSHAASRARRKLGPGVPLLPYGLSRHEIEPRKGKTHLQYLLHLTDSGSAFQLGRSLPVSSHIEYGFNRITLSLHWVLPGQLLHVGWETTPEGMGVYSAQGNLLLHNSEGRWSEVFRDYRTSAVASGAGNYLHILQDFHPEGEGVLLIETEESSSRDYDSKDMGRPFMEGDGPPYRRFRFESEWHGQITSGKLEFMSGKTFLVYMGERKPAITEAAAFLLEEDSRFKGRSLEEIVKQLARLNKVKRTDPMPSRLLVFRELEPFLPNTEHAYSGAQESGLLFARPQPL
jgi:hypothetical protein